MFKVIYIGNTSACFELENDLIYDSGKEYSISVNGMLERKETANVFSVFNLTPDKVYTVTTSLSEFAFEFRTLASSASLSVKSFGATGDGRTLDTRAIQTAINACPKNGRVVIENGVFYSGPIVLKSDMTLEIKKDAKLLASTDTLDYPIWPGEVTCVETGEKHQCASWEGLPCDCYQSFISAHHAKNLAIVGEGEIDGNGQNGIWYINPKQQKIGRPRILFLNGCENVTVHGILASDSASWHYHPFFSRNVCFFDINITACPNSPNTDGCNPESCDGVTIIGAKISVGDDCVAIKSGKLYMGAKYKTPCKNITIRNCLMMRGHGAVVLGSEMAGGIQDLSVTQCVFKKTDRGLRIKTRRGRGRDAVIDGVVFENIIMDNVLTPIVINMFYFCDPDGKTEYVWSKKKLPVDEGTPRLGKFSFKSMRCTDCEHAAGFFYGLPEQPIGEIVIENVLVSFKEDAKVGTPAMMSDAMQCLKTGLYFNNVDIVRLKNVFIEGAEGKKEILENVGAVLYD